VDKREDHTLSVKLRSWLIRTFRIGWLMLSIDRLLPSAWDECSFLRRH
jgi:hypothetical protein